MDFALWERYSELERLGLLADNIRRSLDKIQSRYLVGIPSGWAALMSCRCPARI